MKCARWIGAFVAIGLLLVFTLSRLASNNLASAREHISLIADHPEIRLIDKKEWTGDRVRGGAGEQRVRELLSIRQREIPFRLEQYTFMDSNGQFIVQIWDTMGEIFEVTIRTDKSPKGPTAETTKLLTEQFRGAQIEVQP